MVKICWWSSDTIGPTAGCTELQQIWMSASWEPMPAVGFEPTNTYDSQEATPALELACYSLCILPVGWCIPTGCLFRWIYSIWVMRWGFAPHRRIHSFSALTRRVFGGYTTSTYSATHQIIFSSSIQLSAVYSPQRTKTDLNRRAHNEGSSFQDWRITTLLLMHMLLRVGFVPTSLGSRSTQNDILLCVESPVSSTVACW